MEATHTTEPKELTMTGVTCDKLGCESKAKYEFTYAQDRVGYCCEDHCNN